MTDRWSEPSFSQGDNRFRVWPEGTDKYDHTELASNWDKVDAIFGVPESGEWPVGGLYKEIQNASGKSMPLGLMFPWFRPSVVVPIPEGYVVADGSTLTDGEHDFPGGGNVTLPDLRNRFVLGAALEKEIGADAAPVGNAQINESGGAPGAQDTGGINAATLTAAQLPSHSHTGSLTGWSPACMVWYTQTGTIASRANLPLFLDSRDEAIERCGPPGCYFEPERTAPIIDLTGNSVVETWGHGAQPSSGDGGWIMGQHRHSLAGITGAGSNAPHDNRPRYIGLIWLIKVTDG